jgi:hypothetical protein
MAFAFSDFPNLHFCQCASRHTFPLQGEIEGFHVPLREYCRVRCLLSTGEYIDHEDPRTNDLPLSLPFGSGVTTIFACFDSRSLRRFTYVHHTSFPSAYPAYGCQKKARLTICLPPCSFASLSGSLFIQIPRFIWWYKWSPFFFLQDNSRSDIVSHSPKTSALKAKNILKNS